jgi:hypothetical protein
MKFKEIHFAGVATIQVGVTDELNRVQKQEFSEAFHKIAKACVHMPVELIVNEKKVSAFLKSHRYKKKSVLNLLGRTVCMFRRKVILLQNNFGNKELHSEMWSALSCYMFQQFIFITFTYQRNSIFFVLPVEGVVLNCRAAFLLDYLVCKQKQLQLHLPQLR